MSQLTAAVASMLKRGWLESSKDERHAFFAETEDITSSQGSPEARRASIRVLEVNLLHPVILQLSQQHLILSVLQRSLLEPDISILGQAQLSLAGSGDGVFTSNCKPFGAPLGLP